MYSDLQTRPVCGVFEPVDVRLGRPLGIVNEGAPNPTLTLILTPTRTLILTLTLDPDTW